MIPINNASAPGTQFQNLIDWTSRGDFYINTNHIIALGRDGLVIRVILAGNVERILQCPSQTEAEAHFRRLLRSIELQAQATQRLTNNLESLQARFQAMEQRLNDLEVQLQYAPGGEIFQQAQSHFDSLV